ncbi:MAG: DUF4851 domain-containing protein, partial [Desulfovibrio sp.]|nr:DUF4851 domain-containing protein [Desulfovibrio sp.]
MNAGPRRFPRVALVLAVVLVAALIGCRGALQRGILGSAYVSTARPDIAIEAVDMPLLTGGRGSASLIWSDMLGGLPIQMWLAVYGQGGLSPLAIVAQAAVPQGWYWDSIWPHIQSVDVGVEVFGGVAYQACTYIVDPSRDPFSGLVTTVQPDGSPQLWLARYFAARFNFNDDKIIMEYREPLPEGVVSLSALPYGQADLLAGFAQRARDAFAVRTAPQSLAGLQTGYIQGILWQYMGQNFLGSASKYDIYNLN